MKLHPALLLLALAVPGFAADEAKLALQADQAGPVINRNLYGQFSEHLGRGIYEGIWVGPDSPIPNTRGIRNDVLAALRALHIPVLRWPGGCFADEYHWRNGIGPRANRPAMINTHWGGVVEDNAFGTHEFMDLVDLLGCDAYICGNVGSGTVQEMMEWVEYLTSDADSPMTKLRRANGRAEPWRIRYFGVGNESWGCGGSMTPEYYADNFRRFNTFIKNYDSHRPIERIACGAAGDDYHWTEVLMQRAADRMTGLSLHFYTLPGGDWGKPKGAATGFDEAAWFATLRGTLFMEELVVRHSAIMDKYDPKRRIGLIVDEWGTWYDPEPGSHPGFLYQQNSLRDAVVAALNLHIFQQHAERVRMANIAQTVNVLQAMVLTDRERMLLTPTYHVFEMFKVHQGAVLVPLRLTSPDYQLGNQKIPAVSASASRDAAGRIHLSLVNTNPHAPVRVAATLTGPHAARVSGRLLTGATMDAHNTFDAPDTVHPVGFTGAELQGDQLTVALPPMSVVMLEL